MPGVIKINPSVFKDERDALAVAWNEGLRLWMEDNDYEVQSEPTDEQRAKLSDTAYANDEDAMRKTVMARVITRDTSAPNPSAEQKAEAYALLQMIGDTLPEGSGDLEALELLAEDFEADYQQLSGEVPEQPGEVPEEAVIPEGPEDLSAEVPDATETDQVSDQVTDQVTDQAGTQADDLGGNVAGARYNPETSFVEKQINTRGGADAVQFDPHVTGERINGKPVLRGSNYGQRLRASNGYKPAPAGQEDAGPFIVGGQKTSGFYGELPLKGGGIATEYSTASSDETGAIHEKPVLVPGLSPDQLDVLQNHIIPGNKELTPGIKKKVSQFEGRRKREGKSPFYVEGENTEKYFIPPTHIKTSAHKGGHVNAGTQAADQVGAGTQAAVEGGEVVDPMEQRARVIRWATDALLKESSRGKDQADGDLDTTTGEKRAVGPYQIWRTYVDSANADLTRQGVTDKKELFSYEDRRDFDKARKIVEIRLGSLYDQGTTDPVHLAGRHRVPAGKNHKLWKTPEHEKYLGELQKILKAKPIAGYSSITPAQKASVAAHAARVKEFEARTGKKWY